jgi:L-amino acid N-acyltransferase YncA
MSTATRPAELRDAALIAAIYNEGIRDRGATFETEHRTSADVAAWFAGPDAARFPLLVAEREPSGRRTAHEVEGWIRASAYRPRTCYAGIADFSVYVAEYARGQGVGDTLMRAFIPACEAAGFWKLVARIFPENAASLALCARHGFRHVGVYEKHGQLDGIWRDVIIVERLLARAGSAGDPAGRE